MALTYELVRAYAPLTRRISERRGLITITLDASYDTGGWAIEAEDMPAVLSVLSYLDIKTAVVAGYMFTYDAENGTLMAYKRGTEPAATITIGLTLPAKFAGTWAIDGDGACTNGGGTVGTAKATEMAASYCKKAHDGVEATAEAFSVGGGPDEYAVAWDYWPTPVEAGGKIYFGADRPFCEIAVDNVAQNVYDEAGVLVWEYSKGGGVWGTLTIIQDNSATTATTGAYFGERAGAMHFAAPDDWDLDEVGASAQNAFWIRATVQAGKADHITQIGRLNSKRHHLVESAYPWIAPCDFNVTAIRGSDNASTVPTTETKFLLFNVTSGWCEEFTWTASAREMYWDTLDLDIVEGDLVWVIVSHEDGTNEHSNVSLELIGTQSISAVDSSSAGPLVECDADEAGLEGLVIYAEYMGQ